MTIRLYAEFKKMPLENVSVRLRHGKIHARDCETCETKDSHARPHRPRHHARRRARRRAAQRLMEIADKCPVHQTLTSEVDIRTVEEAGS